LTDPTSFFDIYKHNGDDEPEDVQINSNIYPAITLANVIADISLSLSLPLPPTLPHALTGPRHPSREMTCWLTNHCSQNVHDKI
jgi:hypothetical protein